MQLISSTSSSLNSLLPFEIVRHIFSFVNWTTKDLIVCSQVCKIWNKASKHNPFWYDFCVKEINELVEKNRFEMINLDSYLSFVNYRNLYNKYTAKKFSFQFFKEFNVGYKEMKSERTSLKKKIQTGGTCLVVSSCFVLCCPIWSPTYIINRIEHAFTDETQICKCQSCEDIRVSLFSWAFDSYRRETAHQKRNMVAE